MGNTVDFTPVITAIQTQTSQLTTVLNNMGYMVVALIVLAAVIAFKR